MKTDENFDLKKWADDFSKIQGVQDVCVVDEYFMAKTPKDVRMKRLIRDMANEYSLRYKIVLLPEVSYD